MLICLNHILKDKDVVESYGKNNDILLEGTLAFGQVAAIVSMGGNFELRALSILHPVKVNENKILRVTLKDGHEINIGKNVLKFRDREK